MASSLLDETLHPFVDIGPFRAQSLGLFLGVVAGTNEGTALADLEPLLEGGDPHPIELVRMDPAVDGEVIPGRLEVLTDGDDVRLAPGLDVVHELENLLLLLSDPDHDSGLGHESVGP